MSYEVLARKYRPANFEEVVGQEHIVQAISNSIAQDRIHQSYIFAGTRGVGKTTLARILAKCLNCRSSENPTSKPCNECTNCYEIRIGRHLDFLEIDAASKTGIDDMRDLLETVPHSPSQGKFKVYLIDEVHMLSTSSFNALLKTLEEPPPHIIFILATTNPDKIPKTVQSRCLQLNLKTVGVRALSEHLKKIIELEKITYDMESLDLISDSAKGSVRDALTLLDQAIAHGNGQLEANNVKKLLGTIDNSLLIGLLNSVIDGNGEVSFEHLHKIEELSPEYEVILKSIISILHLVSLEQVLSNSKDNNIKALSCKMDQEFCQLLYEIAVNAYSKFSIHPNAKEALEICLLRMLAFNPLHKIDEESSSKNSAEKKKIKVKIPNMQNSVKVKPESSKAEKIQIKDTLSTKSSSKSKVTSLIFDSHDKWIEFFNGLDLSPFARNYFGSLSFKDYSNNLLVLNTEDDQNNIPENVFAEFKSVCMSKLDKNLSIEIEQGSIGTSPTQRQNEIEFEKQKKAEESVSSDSSIQKFLKKFDGKLKDGSIKPLD